MQLPDKNGKYHRTPRVKRFSEKQIKELEKHPILGRIMTEDLKERLRKVEIIDDL